MAKAAAVRGREIVEIAIGDLKPCPWQREFFKAPTPDAIAALTASLQKDGQQSPIEVVAPGNKAGLPQGTILDGLTRWEIFKGLGAEFVTVAIRGDLAHLDEHALKARFAEFNLGRRHLSTLDRARIALVQYGAKRGKSARSLSHADIRQAIASCLGKTRNANRYARLLQTPIEVQHAHEEGHLRLGVAERVVGLHRDLQADLVAEMAAADPADYRELVDRYLPASTSGKKAPQRPLAKQLASWVKTTSPGLEKLEARKGDFYGPAVAPYLPQLRRIKGLAEALISASRKKGVDSAEVARLLGDLQRSPGKRKAS
jgi:ParB-like chromosome segregation protein Spo0J